MNRLRQAPRNCPVCSEDLILTRLGCPECGTELSGQFETCEYCTLSKEDREALRVFLASRGNMRELERHLGVSYPTARARFDQILKRLGVEERTDSDQSRQDVLQSLSEGAIDVEEALKRLR